jgi:hypothetical protein
MSKQASHEEQAIRLTPQDRMFSFVRSMEGTSVDGQATQADDGNLVVNAELRLMFDYYLLPLARKAFRTLNAKSKTYSIRNSSRMQQRKQKITGTLP